MSNRVSPALTKIKQRVDDMKMIANIIDNVNLDIIKYQNAIEELTFELEELKEDAIHVNTRVRTLCEQAHDEGYDDEYVSTFLKEADFYKHHRRLFKDIETGE